MPDGVKLPIEIIKGDTSGIDAMNALDQSVEEAHAAIKDLAESGALEGLGIGTKEVEVATARITAMGIQARVLSGEIDDLAASLMKMDGSEPDYTKQTAALAKKVEQYQRLQSEIEKLPGKFQDAVNAEGDFNNQLSQQRDRQSVYGDTESAGRAVFGAVGFIGGQAGGQVEQIANIANELLAATEALPLLATGFKEIVARGKENAVALSQNSKIFGTLTTLVTTLTGAKTAEAVATSALIATLAPFVLAAGAAAAAVWFFTNAAKGNKEAVERTIKSLNTYFEAINTGTTDSIAARLEELELQKQIVDERRLDQQSRLDQFNEEHKVLSALSRITWGDGVDAYRASITEANKESQDLAAEIAALEQAMNDARVQARTYAEALATQGAIQADVAAALDAGGLEAAIGRIQDATADRENALERLAFLEAQLATATEEQAVAIRAQQEAILSGDLTSAQRQYEALNAAILNLGYSSVEAAIAAQEAADAQAQQILQERQLRDQIVEMIESGSSEQLQARRDAIAREQAAILTLLPELEALADESQVAAQAAGEYQDRLDSLNAESALLTDNVEALVLAREQEIAAIDSQLTALNEQVALTQAAADMIREGNVAAVNDRLQALEDERAAIEAVLPQLEALAAESDEAAAQLEQYQERIGAVGREADYLVNEVLPQATINQRREGLKELVKAEAESADALKKAAQEGRAQLVELENKASAARADAYTKYEEAINKAVQDSIKARDKANKDFMQDSIKMTREFNKREKEIEQEHNEAILNAREDMLNNMLAAEESNDVIAFVKAKEAGLKQLKELEDGGDKERDQRRREYEERLAERAAEHQQTLNDIRDRENELRQAAQEGYNERIAQIDESLKQETAQLQAALDERVKAEAAALKQRQTEIANQYNLELQAIQTTGKQRTAAINEAGNAVNNLMKTIVNSAASAASAAKSALDSVKSYGGKNSNSTSFSGTNNSQQSNSQAFSFADADMRVVRQPTQALIGENLRPGEFEVVHKYNPSHLLPQLRGGGGDSGLTVNVDLSGSNLRLDEVDARIRAGMGAILKGINKAKKQ